MKVFELVVEINGDFEKRQVVDKSTRNAKEKAIKDGLDVLRIKEVEVDVNKIVNDLLLIVESNDNFTESDYHIISTLLKK